MFRKLLKRFQQTNDRKEPGEIIPKQEEEKSVDIYENFDLQEIKAKPFTFLHTMSAKKSRAIADEYKAVSEVNEAWIGCQESERRASNIGKRLLSIDEEETNRFLSARAEKVKLERILNMSKGEDEKVIANYNADIAEAKLREKIADDQLNGNEANKKNIEEVKKELKEEIEESKLRAEHWQEKKTDHAINRLHTLQHLDEACKQEIRRMLEEAEKEGWSDETVKNKRNQIFAHFENEKRQL